MSDSEEIDYSSLIISQNRKRKKAGGWQSFVFRGVEKKGYRIPTPIQRRTIPAILDRKDLVAMSRTGSGKTAAFLVPMFQKLKRRSNKGARALLISPTRELALQTFQFVKELGKFTGLRATPLVGGDCIQDQFSCVHDNPDIMIATPGRLLHLIVEMDLKLTSIEYVVFDEADRLFELGFAEQLQQLLLRLPDSRQTLLFSATLPKILVDFAKAGLSDPLLVRLDVDSKISDQLEMVFLTCRAGDKLALLLDILRTIINTTEERTIVFCATMKHVEHLSAVLEASGLHCSVLYSQLDAGARKLSISKFRNRQIRLLIVTDVAARGVDIPLLDNAINFHFPPKAKLFVHRVGRVARAGTRGRALSLVATDELAYLADLFLFLGRPFQFVDDDNPTACIGSVPRNVIDSESTFLDTLHSNSNELTELGKTAANAMIKYGKSRPPPAAESVRLHLYHSRPLRKVKELMRTLKYNVHPMFVDHESTSRQNLLNELSSFRPVATIFEINSGNKQQACAIMKATRKAHQQFDRARSKNPFSKYLSEKAEYFVPYAPKDFHSEKALQVDKCFDHQAKMAELELTADDGDGIHRQQQQKKWNRKLKRFVGQSGNEPGRKKIRTENGQLLPASYKSGRYELWRRKQKINDDCEELQPNIKSKIHSKFDRNSTGRNELKSKEQIMKLRKTKERVRNYQSYRKERNKQRKR